MQMDGKRVEVLVVVFLVVLVGQAAAVVVEVILGDLRVILGDPLVVVIPTIIGMAMVFIPESNRSLMKRVLI